MLIRADSNTRANLYWFNFSTANFKPNQVYKFTIWNFGRSLDKFYKGGMNVMVRKGDEAWKSGLCKNVSFEPTQICRANYMMGNQENYYKLSFEFEF